MHWRNDIKMPGCLAAHSFEDKLTSRQTLRISDTAKFSSGFFFIFLRRSTRLLSEMTPESMMTLLSLIFTAAGVSVAIWQCCTITRHRTKRSLPTLPYHHHRHHHHHNIRMIRQQSSSQRIILVETSSAREVVEGLDSPNSGLGVSSTNASTMRRSRVDGSGT